MLMDPKVHKYVSDPAVRMYPLAHVMVHVKLFGTGGPTQVPGSILGPGIGSGHDPVGPFPGRGDGCAFAVGLRE